MIKNTSGFQNSNQSNSESEQPKKVSKTSKKKPIDLETVKNMRFTDLPLEIQKELNDYREAITNGDYTKINDTMYQLKKENYLLKEFLKTRIGLDIFLLERLKLVWAPNYDYFVSNSQDPEIQAIENEDFRDVRRKIQVLIRIAELKSTNCLTEQEQKDFEELKTVWISKEQVNRINFKELTLTNFFRIIESEILEIILQYQVRQEQKKRENL